MKSTTHIPAEQCGAVAAKSSRRRKVRAPALRLVSSQSAVALAQHLVEWGDTVRPVVLRIAGQEPPAPAVEREQRWTLARPGQPVLTLDWLSDMIRSITAVDSSLACMAACAAMQTIKSARAGGVR